MNGTPIPYLQNQVPQDGQDDLFELGDPVVQPSAYPVEEASPMDQVHDTFPSSITPDSYGIKYQTGQKRFAGDPGKAVPVFQRAATDANFGAINVSTANGGTSIVQGRQKGRLTITLSVPLTYTNAAGVAATPNGVVIASLEGEAQTQGSCFQLNPGDSITIATESPIWAGLLPGATTGLVQWIVEYNPAAGELGNT